jgi:nucleolar MIF4G domain-containing protein 1
LTGGRKPHRALTSRKDKRKADRVQKKAQRSGPPPLKRPKLRHTEHADAESYSLRAGDHISDASPSREPTLKAEPKTKSILKTAKLPDEPVKGILGVHPSPPPPEKLPESAAIKIAQDDAEITALEKKLGIKSRKKLPQAFIDDGLDELLEGLDGYSGVSSQASNTDQAVKDRLAQKRSQANLGLDLGNGSREEAVSSSEDEEANSETSSDGDAFYDDEEDRLDESSKDDAAVDFDDNFEGFGSESDMSPPSPPPPRRKENPYIAPTSQKDHISLKYIPPSLRQPPSDSEALVRLRRQAQGLINRLTEANLISILGDVEKLYRENARQHVTSTLVDLLLISVCEPTTLPDTLIILPAGFIAAVYKVIGTDFGAQVIERVVELFDEHYTQAIKASNSGPVASAFDSSKETSNLITLLAELYNFRVVGSNLIFDYIRLFLQTLSELNAELLLRIIRVSGPQLRQDDPSSLRDIVTILRPAVADVGEQNLSVRTKFMIESINDLKNNRVKTGAAASNVISEHTVRMKKTIGTLNTRSMKASEPLRIGLRDIQESDKRGKWWLVGASWAGNTLTSETNEAGLPLIHNANKYDNVSIENGTSDLVKLAREQRMNTDIRRAIFITIMSASDYQDAYLRLMKLKLKKVQELEIPKVIIHCSSAEKYYNPYYTLIAKKLCADRKLRMAFQFNLWDLFKRLGEANDNDNMLEDNDDVELLDTRQLVNRAKMFGLLIVEDGVSLGVLKNLNLRYLQPKTKMFVEVLLVMVLLHTQLQSQTRRDEQAVIRVISKVKDTPSMIRGLQYFLTKVVTKTDIAGGEAEVATLRWACKVAASVLDSMLTADTTKV